jgi:hypothetical protein
MSTTTWIILNIFIWDSKKLFHLTELICTMPLLTAILML